MPGDYPRQSGGGFVGLEEVQFFPNELVDGLRELSRRESSTLFMALLSAVNVLLYSRTGLTDLALTTDVANRNQIEIEQLIGLFTNVVVLRSVSTAIRASASCWRGPSGSPSIRSSTKTCRSPS